MIQSPEYVQTELVSDKAMEIATNAARWYVSWLREGGCPRVTEEQLINPRGFFRSIRLAGIEDVGVFVQEIKAQGTFEPSF